MVDLVQAGLGPAPYAVPDGVAGERGRVGLRAGVWAEAQVECGLIQGPGPGVGQGGVPHELTVGEREQAGRYRQDCEPGIAVRAFPGDFMRVRPGYRPV